MTPSPVYPWLQAQVKPPGVLVQVALVLQLVASAAHSSISTVWHGQNRHGRVKGDCMSGVYALVDWTSGPGP